MMLAAPRDNDGLGWIQILVIVIVAVAYALGGILKSRSSRLEQGDEEPQPSQPRRKPPVGRAVLRRPLPTNARQPSVSTAPTRQYSSQSQRRAGKILRPPPVTAMPSIAESQVLPLPELEPPEVAKPPPAVLLDESMPTVGTQPAAAEEEPAYLAELVSDYADPDHLRTAILHYEILGKPLSLRSPSDRIGP